MRRQVLPDDPIENLREGDRCFVKGRNDRTLPATFKGWIINRWPCMVSVDLNGLPLKTEAYNITTIENKGS